MILKTEQIGDNFELEAYLKEHENKELVRFITCGSVDDGKSTLIGRLLHDSKMIFEDQLAAVEKDSKKFGTTGDRTDLALLVDGLQSEREQGITIDVAYRFFSTAKRKYIIADTPGHEQYTRNMATGASTAQLAIILIDARKGVLTQTRRHSYIASLLGIRNIVVTVNKMDLVGYSQQVFADITRDFERHVVPNLPGSDVNVYYLPVSALEGDNVVDRSQKMPFYQGKTLIELLDTVDADSAVATRIDDFRLPVQYVNRPHLDFRGYAGTIARGRVRIGDEIAVLPSGKTSRVKSIIPPVAKNASEGLMVIEEAFAPMAITITLEEEIDVRRGDMIVHAHQLPQVSDRFSAMVVWMNESTLKLGEKYLIKQASTLMNASFSKILFKKDINTYAELPAETVELNEIACCELNTERPAVVDPYSVNRLLGAFIIIDRYTNNTLGAGMIIKSLSRQAEIASKTGIEAELNSMVRKYFPDWGCREI